ncbi:Gfo/Idh/MocA family protein [Phenylobacterium koreense]|uniref:Dehydrogenase n=1 Tax=Phenylobacterium koreense TaxID=266125 RepID=A0ABV2EN80_9CAUL
MTNAFAPIGVGLIGASPLNPGWAMAAHVPAIATLPDTTLAGVATSSPASAAAAAAALGVPAYSDPDLLIRDPAVDLVVIAVKVEHHHRLAAAAIDAGKPVFVEWPLGRTLEEAEDLAARATRAGVRSFIGLQGRFAPAVERVRELVSGGALGQVLSTCLSGSGMIWGDKIPQTFAYTTVKEAGAGLLAVPLIHALDALAFALGEVKHLSASTAVQRPNVAVLETGEVLAATAPDHVAVSGTLTGGALLTALYRGGPVHDANLRWEVNGTLGDLIVTAENGNLQVADLELHGAWGEAEEYAPIPLTTPESRAGSGVGANVLRTYRAIVHDLRTGDSTAPDFTHAVLRHRLLAAVERAAATGRSEDLS